MTSSGPYSQSYNFTHMFDFTDLKGNPQKRIPNKNSLLDIIEKNKDFSNFYYMLKKCEYDEIFNDIQANFTVFVPSDKFMKLNNISESIFTNMDLLTSRSIVRNSMLNNRIPSEVLTDSPSAYYYSIDKNNRLFITNINNKTTINNNIKVIYKDILATNGIIHVIDNLIIPYIN